MIRARLRAVGHFLKHAKQISKNISDFASCFVPSNFNSVIEAINKMGRINEFGNFEAPSTAFDTGTMFRKCAGILDREYMISKQNEKRGAVKDFMVLFNEDFASAINNAVTETKLQMRRRKKVVLPTIEDIRKLNDYLRQERRKSYLQLLKNFSFIVWKSLASYTLISLQVFNRRRAGELERLHLQDFYNFQTINDDTDKDIYQSLSEESQNATKQYIRIELRGKLGRPVAILMHQEILKCVRLILKHRKDAGVPENNHFVFGLPSATDRLMHLQACVLMRKYSELCGAKNPASLRGTHLRKHIATHSVMMDLQESEISDLANFMGHADKIHKDHYRLPIVTREITKISKFLLAAQGEYREENLFMSESSLPETSSMSTSLTSNFDCEEIEDSSLYKIRKQTWSTPEKQAVRNYFKTYLSNSCLPSINLCGEAALLYPALKNRTPLQIKAWINNENKKKHVDRTPKKTLRTVTQWQTPERHIMRQVFSSYLDKEELPSNDECRKIVSQFPQLRNRKPEHLKAYIHNEIQRNKKKKNIRKMAAKRKIF